MAEVPTVMVVMGVAGCGKTTVGRLLAAALGAAFEEGDAFHDPANIEKMRAGAPLTDADRAPWLARLAGQIEAWLAEGRTTVLACSALKARYREALIGDRPVALVHLAGPEALIRARLESRRDHYMPASLLASQFTALEAPADAINVDIGAEPETIVADILTRLRHHPIPQEARQP